MVDGRTFKRDRQGYKNGYYIGGSLIDEVTPDMTIWKEEIFGPVFDRSAKELLRCGRTDLGA